MKPTRYDYAKLRVEGIVWRERPFRGWYYGDVWIAYNVAGAFDWWERFIEREAVNA